MSRNQRVVAVPLFRKIEGKAPAVHFTHVILAVKGSGVERGHPETQTQRDLKAEGFYNQNIVVGDTLIVRKFDADPINAESPDFNAYVDPFEARFDHVSEHNWVVRMGTARGRLMMGWPRHGDKQWSTPLLPLQEFQQHFQLRWNELDSMNRKQILSASRVLAQAFHLTGCITKAELEFHNLHSSQLENQDDADDRHRELIREVGDAVKLLKARPNLTDVGKFRLAIKSALALVEEAVPSNQKGAKKKSKDVTQQLLSSKKNADRLHDSIAEFKKGKTAVEFDVSALPKTAEANVASIPNPPDNEGVGGKSIVSRNGSRLRIGDLVYNPVELLIGTVRQISKRRRLYVEHDDYSAHVSGESGAWSYGPDWYPAKHLASEKERDAFYLSEVAGDYTKWKNQRKVEAHNAAETKRAAAVLAKKPNDPHAVWNGEEWLVPGMMVMSGGRIGRVSITQKRGKRVEVKYDEFTEYRTKSVGALEPAAGWHTTQMSPAGIEKFHEANFPEVWQSFEADRAERPRGSEKKPRGVKPTDE